MSDELKSVSYVLCDAKGNYLANERLHVSSKGTPTSKELGKAWYCVTIEEALTIRRHHQKFDIYRVTTTHEVKLIKPRIVVDDE